jgi:hypothetical protein
MQETTREIGQFALTIGILNLTHFSRYFYSHVVVTYRGGVMTNENNGRISTLLHFRR